MIALRNRLALLLFLVVVTAVPAQRPNIVVLIADDAGYADWEFMDSYLQSVNPGQAGSPVPTPHLNALHERGVLFHNAYTAPVCSPSRAAIVTGSYQNRIGYEYNINNLTGANAADGLHPSTITLFHRMKSEGYTTGAIGKWHLGARANDNGLGNRPENMQVDEFFGIWKGSRNYSVGGVTGTGTLRETIREPFSDTVLENVAPWNTTYNYVTSAFGKGAIDFIDRHYNDPNPFFLYVAFTAPHGPIGDSPDIRDPRIASLTGTRKQYASMVLTMDKEIGNILAKLDDPAGDGSVSLTDHTLVVFINDNGGASGNGTVNTPLRNWKGSLYEGGTRVPMILAGPGIPSNPSAPLAYDPPVHSIDILPTCLAAAGAAPVRGIDGVNLIPFLTGAETGEPHGRLTFRSGAKAGVRKGNWKLVKNGAGVPFELYDLGHDLSESVDLADANPARVSELLRDFAAFEAGCDKPRHASLGASPDSINQNDRFRFHPAPSGSGMSTGPNVVRNPGFEDGSQADADARWTFAELDDWTDNGTNTADVGAIDNDPHTGSYRGVFVAGDRIPYQLTDHVIAGGETMWLDFWHTGKSGWDSTDTIDVELFYLDGGGGLQVLASRTFTPAPAAWTRSQYLFPAITQSAATGRTLGIRFLANGASGEFVSIDDILLSTGSLDGGGNSTLDWSAGGAWIDGDTASGDTLLPSDAFAGAILEFPVSDTFSYTAHNDMTRMTDLPFMLNQIQLTGTFTGASPQSAHIDGNELLFTRSLSGTPPEISVMARGTKYSFHIRTPLVLFDDLILDGNGDVGIELSGGISNHHEPRGITKRGTSTARLSGTHPYSGPTTIEGGALVLNSGARLTHSSVTILPGGVLGGAGRMDGDITGGTGTVAPGGSTGTLQIGGHAAFGTLTIDVDGADHDRLDVGGSLRLTGVDLVLNDLGGGFTQPAYVIAAYDLLTGPFASVTGMPAGYTIDYAYDAGGSSNQIALVAGQLPSAYDRWIAASGETGPQAEVDADPNQDGLANGLAFFLGAADAHTDATAVLPRPAITRDALQYRFARADAAAGQAFQAEYRSDLLSGNWVAARDGIDGISISMVNDGPTDEVLIRIPHALAGAALYVRLAVSF